MHSEPRVRRGPSQAEIMLLTQIQSGGLIQARPARPALTQALVHLQIASCIVKKICINGNRYIHTNS